MTPPFPTFLIGADRSRMGRTMLAQFLSHWLGGLTSLPCTLVDADPMSGELARRTGQPVVTCSASNPPPAASVVDNAERLVSVQPAQGQGILGKLAGYAADHLPKAIGTGPRAVLCVLLEDGSDTDREAMNGLLSELPDPETVRVVAVRNLGLPRRQVFTEADQRYAEAGGWAVSNVREAWLGRGCREMVFSAPYPSLASQVRGLGLPLRPDLDGENALWLNSRQQARQWRRDFAKRAENTFAPCLPAHLLNLGLR